MVPLKDNGTSKMYVNTLTVELMVTPTPDRNDIVMELLLLRSIKTDDVVTLLPTEVK